MIYTITTKAGATYKTTGRDLRQATWVDTGETAPRWIDTEEKFYGPNATDTPNQLMVCVDYSDDDFTRYEAVLRVRGKGRVTTINFEALYDWGREETSYYVDGEEAEVRDDWGHLYCAHDFCKEAGIPLQKPEIDYDDMAVRFVSDLPEETTFMMDDRRNFANEWILYVRPAAKPDDNDGDDNLREIMGDEALRYLAIAVMDRQDYRAKYGLDPYVAAVMDAEQ